MQKIVIENALVQDQIVNIEMCDGIISYVGTEKRGKGLDAEGRRVIPGLIETHAHGCIGMDALDGDFAPMCDFLARQGTTTWLPTTMTMDTDTLIEVTHKKTDFDGTYIHGFHLEGPYISPKYKGAQNENYIKAPDYEEFCRFGNVKMISLAPEQPGTVDFIRKVTSQGVIVAFGHTDTDYDTAIAAIDAGASCLTHTFNCMQPLHHRKPGPIGAAVQRGLYAQLITDGVHIHPASVYTAWKMFGTDRLTIISDSIRPAGFAEGVVSDSGGLAVQVRGGAVYIDGTDTLAGSGSTLLHCVDCAVKMGIPFADAVTMATRTPARHLGLNKGVVAEGFDADLLILSDEKDELKVDEVFIDGKRYQ